jgi:hypothetical protein
LSRPPAAPKPAPESPQRVPDRDPISGGRDGEAIVPYDCDPLNELLDRELQSDNCSVTSFGTFSLDGDGDSDRLVVHHHSLRGRGGTGEQPSGGDLLVEPNAAALSPEHDDPFQSFAMSEDDRLPMGSFREIDSESGIGWDATPFSPRRAEAPVAERRGIPVIE